MTPIQGMESQRRHVTEVDGYEIHSVEVPGGDRTVVMLHGLSGSSRWWRRNVAGLSEKYRLLIPDLVGFGRTACPGPMPHPQELADLLAAWMIELNAPPAHLVGHSMGGQIALHLAASHPQTVDRLVLVDSAGIPRPRTPGQIMRFAADIAPIWRWGDPRFLPTILGDALTAGPRTIARAASHILDDDVRPLLEHIRVPTLILWGDRDRWIPIEHGEALAREMPDARLVVMAGAGHNPMVDRPGDFNRIVLEFLGESG